MNININSVPNYHAYIHKGCKLPIKKGTPQQINQIEKTFTNKLTIHQEINQKVPIHTIDHKIILIDKSKFLHQSEFFSALLTSGMKEAQNNKVDLFYTYQQILPIIQFLETGKIELTGSNVINIALIADYLQISNLFQKCLTFIKENINYESAFQILTNPNFTNQPIKDICQDIINQHFSEKINATNLQEILNNPNIRYVTALKLNQLHLGDTGISIIASCSNLKNLTSLDLRMNNISAEGASALANSDNLHNLTSLNLGKNNIGAEGASALANSDNLHNLTSLNLRMNNIRAEGASALANSDNLHNLTFLNLGNNIIANEGTVALANSAYLGNLTSLNLSGWNKIDYEGVIALANSNNFYNLTSLNLRQNNIGTEEAVIIIKSTHLSNLNYLNLEDNPIDVEKVKAITIARPKLKVATSGCIAPISCQIL